MVFGFKNTRLSALGQIVLGLLLIMFGIADRATIYYRSNSSFHTRSVVPIWMGAWIFITGVIGFAGSKPNPNGGRPSTALIGTYLGFSIVSIIFAGVILILYILGIASILGGTPCSHKTHTDFYYNRYEGHYVRVTRSVTKQCNTSVALGSLVIIFAIIEFGVGIWASICCCSEGHCCNCCKTTTSQLPQMGQVIYIQTQHGPMAYITTQGPNGLPIAVPTMTPGPAGIINPHQAPVQAHNQQVMQPCSYGGAGAATGEHCETKQPHQPPPYQGTVQQM